MSDLDWNTIDEQLSGSDDRSYPLAEDAMHHVAMPRRGGEIDWDGFEDPDVPPSPVKVIEVTDEMRAADAAQRAAREQLAPEHPWAAVKASLSNDNLQTVKRKPRPGYAPDERQYAVPRDKRVCACGRRLSLKTIGDLCFKCVRAAARPPRKRCTRCDAELVRNAKGDICLKCRGTPRIAAVRFIGDPKPTDAKTAELVEKMLTTAHAQETARQLGHAAPIQKDQETTMSKEVLCKGGCGRPVAPSNVAKGFLYSYACRKTGCAPLKPAKAAKRGRPCGTVAPQKPGKKGVAHDAAKPAPTGLVAILPTVATDATLMLPVSEATLDRYLLSLRREAKVQVVSALLRDLAPEAHSG